jgi:hypothetical protein
MDKENVIHTLTHKCYSTVKKNDPNIVCTYEKKKKNEIILFAGKWMELKIIILDEIYQTEKGKYYIFSLICRI